MKIAFIHDTRLIKLNEDTFYSVGFTYELWKRYLDVFDKIVVVTKYIEIKNEDIINNMKYKISSGSNVAVLPVESNIWSKVKHICSIIKSVDGVIIRLPSLLGIIAFFACRKYKKAYLVELVGCPWDALWNHSLKGKIVAPFFYSMVKYIMRHAKHSIYVTNVFLQKRYPTKGLSIGCSDVFITPQTTFKERKIDLEKKIKLGTIGGLNVRYKGYDQVVRMLEILNGRGENNIEYHLVGDGSYKWLMDIAIKCNIENKVIIHGPISHDKIFSFLDSLDIYIQPSLQEGMPRSLLEAMSRGCPCIGSNAGGIPELLDYSVIYKKNNIKELIDIYSSFTNNKLEKQSVRNFQKSLEFTSEKLSQKRKDFLFSFKKSITNIEK